MMSVIEIRSTVTHRSLMHKSKSDLARHVLELMDLADRQQRILNTPSLDDFAASAAAEAKHQIYRWGAEQDAKKTAWDWFWLIGHLASKCAHSALAGDWDKARHHAITTAATLANWHRQLSEAQAPKGGQP
jgi:hypothetical protein